MDSTVGQGHNEACAAVGGNAYDFGVLPHRRPGDADADSFYRPM